MTTATTANRSEAFLVDSSGWLEFLTEDSLAAAFEPYLQPAERLVVPTIVLYEVGKKLLATRGELAANQFLSRALRSEVVPLDETLALAAAEASLKYHLPMADAIIYATARSCNAQLITSDPHFEGLPGVTLI